MRLAFSLPWRGLKVLVFRTTLVSNGLIGRRCWRVTIYRAKVRKVVCAHRGEARQLLTALQAPNVVCFGSASQRSCSTPPPPAPGSFTDNYLLFQYATRSDSKLTPVPLIPRMQCCWQSVTTITSNINCKFSFH